RQSRRARPTTAQPAGVQRQAGVGRSITICPTMNAADRFDPTALRCAGSGLFIASSITTTTKKG
ncbi:MAG: hypothetical protein KA804_04075, partial [Ottowia sp.]|nr:hypothetical protein [Ottowia sp.]MBP9672682.1 hypothetical protein [Ottowia sp.]